MSSIRIWYVPSGRGSAAATRLSASPPGTPTRFFRIFILCPKSSSLLGHRRRHAPFHVPERTDPFHRISLPQRASGKTRHPLPEGVRYGEDLEFVWKYLAHCRNACFLEARLYGYDDRPDSAVHQVSWSKTDLADAMLRTGNTSESITPLSRALSPPTCFPAPCGRWPRPSLWDESLPCTGSTAAAIP